MKYIELNTFLKIRFLLSSGGHAKQTIQSEKVKVNGELETRNKRKLVAGDKVELDNKTEIVNRKECLKES